MNYCIQTTLRARSNVCACRYPVCCRGVCSVMSGLLLLKNLVSKCTAAIIRASWNYSFDVRIIRLSFSRGEVISSYCYNIVATNYHNTLIRNTFSKLKSPSFETRVRVHFWKLSGDMNTFFLIITQSNLYWLVLFSIPRDKSFVNKFVFTSKKNIDILTKIGFSQLFHRGYRLLLSFLSIIFII